MPINNSIDAQLGAKLRKRRQDLGIIQANAAQVIGVEFEAMQRMEDGFQRLSAEQLQALCRLYSMTPADIYEGLEVTQKAQTGSPKCTL